MKTELDDFLFILDKNTKLFGMANLLKELHSERIAKEFSKKVHISTYYYWLSGKSPIPLKYLYIFTKYDSQLLSKVFVKCKYFSSGQRKCKLPKKFNNDLAYLIGVLHGDGSLNKNKKFVTITCSYGPYLKDVVKPIIDDTFEIKSNLRKIDSQKYYRLEIGNKVIHSFLSLFCPIGKKKGKLKIPEFILSNENLLKIYLGGFFDTDGCISRTKKNRFYFSFMQSDKKIVEEIFESLKKLNIDINPPRKSISPASPRDRKNKIIEWRIDIASHKTLCKFLRSIEFRNQIKKKRAYYIINKIMGPGGFEPPTYWPNERNSFVRHVKATS